MGEQSRNEFDKRRDGATDPGDRLDSAKRRAILRLAAVGGGLGVIPSGVTATESGGSGSGTSDGQVVQLGDFESGLDGWKTNGGNELTRVTDDEIPAGVVSGQHALAVEVNGDLFPMIESKKRVKEADFTNNSYLQAHVLGYAEETDSDMVFKFRLHHTDTPANGQGSGDGGVGSKDVLVVESDEQTVAQLDPHHVRWDLRALGEDILETATRLEIVWYLEEHPPERDHRGLARGDFDFQGLVTFDDIGLTDDVAGTEARASREKRRELHRKHGMIVERTFEELTEDVERGTLVFVDGTEIPYSFAVLDNDRFEYAIDGETFEIGGGL